MLVTAQQRISPKHPTFTACFQVFKLFEGILAGSQFPDAWKSSYFTPNFKTDDKLNVECYRPVSLLSKLSLVFEKLLNDKLYALVSNCLSSRQFGFVRKKLGQTRLLIFLQDISKTFDTNGDVYAVYLDFCKAFVKVSHNILLQKLHKFGIWGELLLLLASCLSSRKQTGKIN